MIKLKNIITEINDSIIKRLLQKIKNKQFSFFNKGSNGRIYKIENEDFVFKITTEGEEFLVAEQLENNYTQFNAFIPVYYTNETEKMYIMSLANELDVYTKTELSKFIEEFKQYSMSRQGEVSVFDFLKEDTFNLSTSVRNFLGILEQNVMTIGIPEFALDLDFRLENIMSWNGNIVMVDW